MRMPTPVLMFAAVSFLNEVSAHTVTPLIPTLLASVLAAGPIALGLVESLADAVAAMPKLWSGRRANVHLQQHKPIVVLGYGLATLSHPLMALAGSRVTVAALPSADRLGKGIRGAPLDPMSVHATPSDQRGRMYELNQAMDYVGARIKVGKKILKKAAVYFAREQIGSTPGLSSTAAPTRRS